MRKVVSQAVKSDKKTMMKNEADAKLPGRQPGFSGKLPFLPYTAFFTAILLSLAIFANYLCFYQEQNSIFLTSSDFLIDTIKQPGGFLVWSALLITSFFHFPAIGAVLVSVLLALFALSTASLFRHLSGKNGVIPAVIFTSALFWLQTDYRFLLLNTLGFLLQAAIFLAVIKFLKGSKVWIAVALIPLWYFLTGSFSAVFIIMLALWLFPRGVKPAMIFAGSIIAISIVTFYISKEYLFFQTTRILLTYPLTQQGTGSQLIQTGIFAGLFTLIPLMARISWGKMKMNHTGPALTAIITSVLAAGIITAIAVYRFDTKTQRYFAVEKLFSEGRYDDVIAFNLKHRPGNQLTVFLNNVAMCEKDKLNDMLFSFPQKPDGSTLFLKWEMIGEILRRGGYFYYATGMINEAHRWAFENMVMRGFTPAGLRMLIKTELINGNYTVADKYIKLLGKTFFYRAEAAHYELLLYNDKAVDADPELGAKRREKVKGDFFTISDDPVVNIERVLNTDSLNRKVFAYKVALELLRKDFESITADLPRFSKYGYTSLPLNVEEAAAALSLKNNGRLPDLGGLQLSQATASRWKEFMSTIEPYGRDIGSAEPAVRKKFANTFWYHVFFRQ